jgi:hypothetical protein
VTQAVALGAPRRRGQFDPPEDLTEHDAYLGQCERRTEAAATAATEGDPDVGIRTLTDETLRAELERLGIQLGVSHDEVDRRVDEGPRRQPQLLGPH